MMLVDEKVIGNKDNFLKALLAREAQSTTEVGVLSMTFGAVSKAPHGGIFAIAVGVVSNPIMYLLALVLGSVLGAILLIVSLNLGKKVEK